MNNGTLLRSGWTGKSFEDYIQQAFDEWDCGTCNKASFKRAGEALNHAYDLARETIQKGLLETPREERDEDWNDKYWSAIHYCHQWRAKHSDAFRDDYRIAVSSIERVIKIKKMMKESI